MQWDPKQYQVYADERSRPFLDLIARIQIERPRRIVDLGCGPGNLTALLAQRWPEAEVVGVDSSPEMIERARPEGNLRFELADANRWQPDERTDVLVSNAALQWLPEHRELLRGWAAALPREGWMAWQVPGNFDAPSHALMREVAESPRWRERLNGVQRTSLGVASPSEYLALLLEAGWKAESWETTYLHLLQGEDAVLEWVRGTGLRPMLAALDEPEARAYEEVYRLRLREAYPAGPYGTVFPFRRIFCVGHKP